MAAIDTGILLDPVDGLAFIEWDLTRRTSFAGDGGPLINFCARPRYKTRGVKAAIGFRLTIELMGMTENGTTWGYVYRLCCNNLGTIPHWTPEGPGIPLKLPLSDEQKAFQDRTSLNQGWRMDSLYHVYNGTNFDNNAKVAAAPFRNGFSYRYGGQAYHFQFLNKKDFATPQPLDITLWPGYDHFVGGVENPESDSNPQWMNFAMHLAPGHKDQFFAINSRWGHNLVTPITDSYVPPMPQGGTTPNRIKVRITFSNTRGFYENSPDQQVVMQLCNVWIGAEELKSAPSNDRGFFMEQMYDYARGMPIEKGTGTIAGGGR